MEDSGSTKEVRLVFYSDEAGQDLASIHTYTAQAWGEDQAESYLDLIESEVERVAQGEAKGQALEGFPRLFRRLVRWPGAYYSHWIIYQEGASSLVVVRVLHTAMNLPDHIT
jgi:toxin ParE1/3/4